MEHGKAVQRLNKATNEIKSYRSQEPALRKQIQAQEGKVKETTLDPARLAKLQKVHIKNLTFWSAKTKSESEHPNFLIRSGTVTLQYFSRCVK